MSLRTYITNFIEFGECIVGLLAFKISKSTYCTIMNIKLGWKKFFFYKLHRVDCNGSGQVKFGMWNFLIKD